MESSSTFLLEESKMPNYVMMRYLARLNRTNLSTWRFSKQSALFIGVFYYAVLAVMDGALFVLVDQHSAPMLRVVAAICLVVGILVALVTFSVLASVNILSRRLIGALRRCQHRLNLSARLKLKLTDFLAQIESNRVGISCGTIFMFSPSKLYFMAINFVLNFILAVDLFQNYLFRSSQ